MYHFDSNELSGIRRLTVLLGLAAALFATSAPADEYHYINIPVGERAAGMAGAFTAVSDNASGCFHNPAGIVYSSGSALSASVNAFNHSEKSYNDALKSTEGGAFDWEQESSVLLPNYFGTIFNFGPGKLGFSYAVPDSIQREQEQNFSNIQTRLPGVFVSDYTININDVDNTYLFGPSYAVEISESLSAGLTMYAHYRDSTIIRNQVLQLSTGEFEWTNAYEYREEWGVKPILGLMWSPAEKLSFGLTASRVFVLSADNKVQTTYRGISSLGFSDPDLILHDIEENEEERDLPWTGKFGVAWFPSPSFLLSMDVSYHTGEEWREPVLNAAVGAEIYLSPSWAIRAGLYSDRANTPDLKRPAAGDTPSSNPQAFDQRENVDLYGGTFSVTKFTRSTSVSLGVGYAFGEGDAQIKSGNPEIQDLEIHNLTAFLSAGYSF